MSNAEDNKVRGQGFPGILGVLDEVAGPGAKARTLALLPKEIADAQRYGAVVAGGWYPIAWYCELHRAIKRAKPDAKEIHRRLGYASTTRDLHAVYRFILQLASPGFAFGHANRILGTYFRECRSELLENGPQHASIRLEIPGASLEIWSDVVGSAEAILCACGGHEGTVSLRPGASSESAVLKAAWAKSG